MDKAAEEMATAEEAEEEMAVEARQGVTTVMEVRARAAVEEATAAAGVAVATGPCAH